MGILKRFWPILQSDTEIRDVIICHPSVTYRRGRNFRDSFVHSHFQGPPTPPSWLTSPTVGSHPCGTCSFCEFIPKKKSFINPIDNHEYKIKDFINCKTSGVVYIAQCCCTLIYVGKTIQPLRRRICQHLSTINRGVDTPISRHVRFFHDGNVKALKFWGIEKVRMGPRKGNLDTKLLQIEAKWIFKLDCRSPKGLNEGFTFTPFL